MIASVLVKANGLRSQAGSTQPMEKYLKAILVKGQIRRDHGRIQPFRCFSDGYLLEELLPELWGSLMIFVSYFTRFVKSSVGFRYEYVGSQLLRFGLRLIQGPRSC
jgi:hypothetical protein